MASDEAANLWCAVLDAKCAHEPDVDVCKPCVLDAYSRALAAAHARGLAEGKRIGAREEREACIRAICHPICGPGAPAVEKVASGHWMHPGRRVSVGCPAEPIHERAHREANSADEREGGAS